MKMMRIMLVLAVLYSCSAILMIGMIIYGFSNEDLNQRHVQSITQTE